ncbi:hypothetical protein FA014_08765 [Cellulomonas hominis]|uniref:Uncharacterized protein n=1 Tax=Cellulomonas hominis TaxID=156981 RepID=A0A7Z8NQX6_9CELL|nr:hypothetical protein [Cellulomonas hominis]TKR23913.1 hypothetical protein FA014_08765 [Cellulomonas hominis]
MTEGLVRIPKLTSRSGWRWIVATVVALVVVGVYVGVTQPDNRIFVVTVLPAFLLFFTVLSWFSTWLDPVAGTAVRVRCRLWRTTVRLEPSTSVSLVSDRGGTLLLRARPAEGRGLHVPVVARTDYVEKSQPPALLRQLADTVEQHRAGGARPVAEALRKQAAHLEAGGTVATSPLAGLITTGMLTAAKAGGAGAAGGQLG